MPKNIVLLVDGTGMNGEKAAPGYSTNVWKLHHACAEPEGLNLYMPGVGSRFGDIIGALAGFGTKKRLRQAYDFLVRNYQQNDHIFLFGFSRGALAVRLFAGFLGYVGTLFGSGIYRRYFPSVYQVYESSVFLNATDRFHDYMRHFGETTPLPIHFLGVWDTVEEYWRANLPEIEELPNHISHARHALAVHERRGEMEPTLWKSWDAAKSTVQQVWFPGAHSDVGGGYPESKLAEAPLSWMSDEARKCGLKVTPVAAQSAAKPVLHQDRTGGKVVGEFATLIFGEGPRQALSGIPSLPKNSQLIGSLYAHQTACDHLLQPISKIKFVNYSHAKDGKATADLKRVDEITVQMVLTLRAAGHDPVK